MSAEPERRESPWVRGSRFAALGLEFGVTVAAGVIAGYYVDQWTGVSPLCTLLFTLGAMGGALYRLMWTLRRFQ